MESQKQTKLSLFSRQFSQVTDSRLKCSTLASFHSNPILLITQLDAEDMKIRRKEPLPPMPEDLKEETVARSIYCKGIPKDGSVTLDDLLEYFKPYQPFETIHVSIANLWCRIYNQVYKNIVNY